MSLPVISKRRQCVQAANRGKKSGGVKHKKTALAVECMVVERSGGNQRVVWADRFEGGPNFACIALWKPPSKKSRRDRVNCTCESWTYRERTWESETLEEHEAIAICTWQWLAGLPHWPAGVEGRVFQAWAHLFLGFSIFIYIYKQCCKTPCKKYEDVMFVFLLVVLDIVKMDKAQGLSIEKY